MAAKRNIYTDGDYLEANPDWHEGDASWKAASILRLLALEGYAPRQVLEIGCGSGAILEELSKSLPDAGFCGYEISPQAFEICKRRSSERLRFVSGDFFLDASHSSDLLLAIDVVEHVPDYLGFLEKLGPYGRRHVFHIPLEMHCSGLMRPSKFSYARKAVGHLHFFNATTARDALEASGYRILRTEFTHGSSWSPSHRAQVRTRLMNLFRSAASSVSEDFASRLLGGMSLMVLAEWTSS